MFDMREQLNTAAPIVDMSGESVSRVALALGTYGTVGYTPSVHYRRPESAVTLCGLPIGDSADAGDLGVCQACRAEASRLKVKVGR